MATTSPSATHEPTSPSRVSRLRFAKLAGRPHGHDGASGCPLVLLHGLTFDRRMWDPILEELPPTRRAIAFDLPGHGGSAPLPRHNLEAVVEAIHDAVVDAKLERPIVVGHSIGGPLAMIYATAHPVAAVVSVEAPVRLEPFAEQLRSLAADLAGDRFDEVWSTFRAGLRVERVPERYRPLLDAGDHASQEIVLGYQSDILQRPLDEVVRWRDAGLRSLRAAGVPYLALHADPVDPAEKAWLASRLPQAEIVVWPVAHHFPHLADPARFAALLSGLAAGVRR